MKFQLVCIHFISKINILIRFLLAIYLSHFQFNDLNNILKLYYLNTIFCKNFNKI